MRTVLQEAKEESSFSFFYVGGCLDEIKTVQVIMINEVTFDLILGIKINGNKLFFLSLHN